MAIDLAALPDLNVEYPVHESKGRGRVPSVYEDRLTESYEKGIGKAIPFDGTDEMFKDIVRELTRGARHLGYGLRKPKMAALDDGTAVVVYQAIEKRRGRPSNA